MSVKLAPEHARSAKLLVRLTPGQNERLKAVVENLKATNPYIDVSKYVRELILAGIESEEKKSGTA